MSFRDPIANEIIIQDRQGRRWLRFGEAVEIITATSIDQVWPNLRRIDKAVNDRGLYGVGYISYEAAPAFDDVLRVRTGDSGPLMWFGLYQQPEEISVPDAGPAYELGEWRPSINREEYQQSIERIKELIALGCTYQVNYTYRLASRFKGEPWGMFLDLIRAQEGNYAAYMDTGDRIICSTSPELFFELNGDELLSRPMKGTARRAPTYSEDLEQSKWLYRSEKNRTENVMIVDMIRSDMGRVSRIGSVHAPHLFDVERYPTIWQMTSTVRSRTDASIPEILSSLFPCASITGAPKVSTMGIIAELETTPRGVYTGCIGYLAPDRRAQFNVAIRTVVVDKVTKLAEYGVGGGIVWDSRKDDEYEECQTKARVLSDRRPDFKLLESILWTPDIGYYLLDEHLQRLDESGKYFGFTVDLDAIRIELEFSTGSFLPCPLKVRVQVSKPGEIEINSIPVESQETVSLALAGEPINSGEIFLYHKTTHRQVYERAFIGLPDCEDVLLWNERGEITETTTANIVVEIEGKLLTPPVESGLLAGTYRNTLLNNGKLTEQILTLDDLSRRSSLFAINSVRRWRKAELIREPSLQRLSPP